MPVVNADRISLQHVILDLIVNAMDAIDENDAERAIVVRTRSDQDCVEIAVSDTGPGIPAEYRARLFEPFFTTKAEGIGLGLSIARSIVKLTRGQIWADEHSGRAQLPAEAALAPKRSRYLSRVRAAPSPPSRLTSVAVPARANLGRNSLGAFRSIWYTSAPKRPLAARTRAAGRKAMVQMLRFWLALIAAAALLGPVSAQDYPSRAVKIIVPFGAGGPADIYARVVGQHSAGVAQAAVRGRGPTRRRLHHGHRRGRQGRARRLHAADDVQHPHRQRDAAAQPPVRADARLRRGGADQLLRPNHGGAPIGACERPRRSSWLS